MKRIILMIVAIFATTLTFASGGGLPFNYGYQSPDPNNFLGDLVNIANRQPNVHDVYAQAFGDKDWDRPGNLRVVGRRTLKPGTKFTNSYLDGDGKVFQAPDTAETEVELIAVMSLSTGKIVWVKGPCFNLAGLALEGVHSLGYQVQQVTDIRLALRLSLASNSSSSSTASATASTAPINNTMMMYMPRQQPLYMVGASPLQFMRVERPGVQIGVGYFWTRPSNINITNVNMNSNTNTNENNNSNSNSNVNNNTVNVGGGCG